MTGRPISESRGAGALYYTIKVLVQAGQNVLLAALFIQAGTSSTAGIDLSSVFVALLLPSILFGALGGALVDRIGPARGYFLGTLVQLSAIAFGLFTATTGNFSWAVAFAYGLGSQVFGPADLALVRTLRPGRAGRVHSTSAALQYAGQGAGMLVLAPLLYVAGGTPALFLGAALTFSVISVLAACQAHLLRETPAACAQPAAEAFSFRSVCSFFVEDRRATYAVAALGFKTLVGRAVVVALPFYLTRDMGLGREALMFLVIPAVVGVVFALGYAWRGLTLASARGILRLSMIGMAVGVLALAALDFGVTMAAHYSQVPPIVSLEARVNTTFVVAVPVAFLLGLCLTTSLIAGRVVLTECAPIGRQARIFAVQETVTESLMALPLLSAGIGIQYAGARPTLAVIGALAVAALLALEVVAAFDRRTVRARGALPAAEAAN